MCGFRIVLIYNELDSGMYGCMWFKEKKEKRKEVKEG